jgi:hypothetical protein
MLDGILGNGDTAGPQPPRQGRDQSARRIAGQRIDEPMNWPRDWPVARGAQSAAFA